MDGTQLMTVAEVAKTLRVSQRQVWKLNASGRMPVAIRVGRSVRWRAVDIEQWIAAGCPRCDAPEKKAGAA